MATAFKNQKLFNNSARGYHAVYRENQVNHCPGCGRTHWMIGRTMAECAFCATALPLDASLATPSETAVIAVNDNHRKINHANAAKTKTERSNVISLDDFGRGLFNNAARGYHAVYRENQVNHCPGCGRTHWLIGRQLAECGFCSTAMPLDSALASNSDAEMIVAHDNHSGLNREYGSFHI